MACNNIKIWIEYATNLLVYSDRLNGLGVSTSDYNHVVPGSIPSTSTILNVD